MSSRDIVGNNEVDKSNGTDMIMGSMSNGENPKSTTKGNIDPSQKTPTPLMHQSLSGQWSVTIKTPGIHGDAAEN